MRLTINGMYVRMRGNEYGPSYQNDKAALSK